MEYFYIPILRISDWHMDINQALKYIYEVLELDSKSFLVM